MSPRRSNVSLIKGAAMTVTRVAARGTKLAYVIVANKKIKYKEGSSPIVYIGTTRTGFARVAQSAAYRTEQILNRHGISSFDVRIVTCRPRRNVKTWVKLERALLLVFRDVFGTVPLCNVHGKSICEMNEFKIFEKKRIKKVILDLS